MEEQLNLIARGEADFLKVLGDVLKLFKKKYQFFTKNIEDMDSLFEVSFTPLADSGKALSRSGIFQFWWVGCKSERSKNEFSSSDAVNVVDIWSTSKLDPIDCIARTVMKRTTCHKMEIFVFSRYNFVRRANVEFLVQDATNAICKKDP